MKRSILSLFLLAGLLSLSACKKEDEIGPESNINALREQLHGKYGVVQSVSSEALDLNSDGNASTNMLEELTGLESTFVDVKVHQGIPKVNSKPSFLFVHQWLKQELKERGSTDSKLYPIYMLKVVHWDFTYDKLHSKILLEPHTYSSTDPDIDTPPQTIIVKGNNLIEVTLTKRLYTSNEWKTVQIVTLYERFYTGI